MSLNRDEIDSIQDEHSAARAWLELEHERQQPGLSTGRGVENRAATEKLERDWPQSRDLAATAADHELGGLPKGLRRTRDQHRQRHGVTARSAAHQRRRRAPTASSRTAAPRARSPRAPSARPSRGASRSLLRQARGAGETIAPVGFTAGQLAAQTFAWGIGLSMLYLLLTRGTGAVDAISRGMANTVAVLVNPLADPLSPAANVGGTGKPSDLQRAFGGQHFAPLPSPKTAGSAHPISPAVAAHGHQ